MKLLKLSQLAEVIAGQSPPSKTYNIDGHGLPFFQGKSDFQEKYPKTKIWCTSEKRKEAKAGDVLISVRAPVGSVNICDQPSIIGRGLSAIRPFEDVYGEYLYYFFKSNEQKIANLGTGSTFKAITQQILKKIQIPIPIKNGKPSLDDQVRIATLLKKVESLIARRTKTLKDLDELLKSIFMEMFGDPVRNEKGWDKLELKRFGKIITGNTPSRKDLANYSSEYIEWIKTDNILTDSLFVSQAREYLSKTGAEKGRILDAGALLVACIAGSLESIGRSALTNRRIAFNQQINAIQPNEKVNSLYLYELFKISKKYVQSQATKGMKKILTKGDFQKIKMIKPPVNVQNQFAVIVEKVESIKERYRQSLSELESLYGALSQKAFKGELDLGGIPLEKGTEGQHKAIDPENKKAVSNPEEEILIKPEDRDRYLRQLFDTFLSGRNGKPFFLEDFWPEAEAKLMDIMDDESSPLGIKEHDMAKGWLFELLESGRAKQDFNEDENRMEISIKV